MPLFGPALSPVAVSSKDEEPFIGLRRSKRNPSPGLRVELKKCEVSNSIGFTLGEQPLQDSSFVDAAEWPHPAGGASPAGLDAPGEGPHHGTWLQRQSLGLLDVGSSSNILRFGMFNCVSRGGLSPDEEFPRP